MNLSLKHLFLGNTAAHLVVFVAWFALGFVLDAESLGAFRVAWSFTQIAANASALGLPLLLLRMLPSQNHATQCALMRGALSLILVASLGFGALASQAIKARVGFLFHLGDYSSLIFSVLATAVGYAILAWFQSTQALHHYAYFQMGARSLLCIGALIGALFGRNASSTWMGMAWGCAIGLLWGGVMLRSDEHRRLDPTPLATSIASLWPRLLWPFVLTVIALLSTHAEMLYVTPQDVQSGRVGAYSWGALTFQAGVALCSPFQTYAVSQLIHQPKNLWGATLIKLSSQSLGSCLAIAGLSYGAFQMLSLVFPERFNDLVLHFSFWVGLKLLVFGGYAVTGAALYPMGLEKSATLSSALSLAILVLIPTFDPRMASLDRMLLLQVILGLILCVSNAAFSIYVCRASPVR